LLYDAIMDARGFQMHALAALADPTRRHIVELLAQRELAAGEIGDRFPLSAPAISQHLKALRAAGLVRVRIEAQRRIYELDPNGFAELDKWLGAVRQSWRGRLTTQERRLIKRADGKASPGDASRA
jgi:DNA-binding transcriptional ArsR family regulator